MADPQPQTENQTMDEATKARLAEHRRRKRAGVGLLKGLSPGELGIACDWLKERGLAPMQLTKREWLAGQALADIARYALAIADAILGRIAEGACRAATGEALRGDPGDVGGRHRLPRRAERPHNAAGRPQRGGAAVLPLGP